MTQSMGFEKDEQCRWCFFSEVFEKLVSYEADNCIIFRKLLTTKDLIRCLNNENILKIFSENDPEFRKKLLLSDQCLMK